MKVTITILALLVSMSVFANPAMTTVVDYLRGTPAYVSGNIRLDQSMQLYEGKYGILPTGMVINARKPINFTFSEHHLDISSEEGISLKLGGIPFKVKNIAYDDRIGKFTAKTDTPMGIGARALNSQIEQVLNSQYKGKLIKAFNELKSIRSKQNLKDVNQVINTITAIFSTPGPALPTVRGNVELGFIPSANKRLKLDQWKADLQQNDSISIGMDFVRTRDQLKVNAVEMNSYKGIRISGRTNFPEIASINFRSMRADAGGIKFNYEIGAEEVITGFVLLTNVIRAYASRGSSGVIDCDPVRLEAIRNSLDANLRKEIAVMIRKYRAEFIKAGASPQLLAALD